MDNLIGCGKYIIDGICGETGLCVTCWEKRHDLHTDTIRAERDRYREALLDAHKAIHDLCLERQSTEGYRLVFDRINQALAKSQEGGSDA